MNNLKFRSTLSSRNDNFSLYSSQVLKKDYSKSKFLKESVYKDLEIELDLLIFKQNDINKSFNYNNNVILKRNLSTVEILESLNESNKTFLEFLQNFVQNIYDEINNNLEDIANDEVSF